MNTTEWWEDGENAKRLVLADALSAAGNPLGEFIVLQCTAPDSPRLLELWNANQLSWLTGLGLPRYNWGVKRAGLSSALFPSKSGLEAWTAEFQRGFLTRLWAPRVSESLAASLAEHAVVRHLELEDWDLDAVISRISLFRLEALGVMGGAHATMEQLDALAASRAFSQLAELSFNVGTEGADARAERLLELGGRAERLTRLALSGALTPRPLRALRRHDWCQRLKAFDFAAPDVSEELPAVLDHLPSLESVTLSVHRATPELAEALLRHPSLIVARVRTSAPTPLSPALTEALRAKLGPEALVRL